MFRVGSGILEIGRRPVTLHRKDTITRCARVSVAKTVHIGPEQEVVIEGHIESKRLKSNLSNCMVEPQGSFTDKTGLWMARSLARADQTSVPISVINPSTEQITLKQRQPIALFHPLNLSVHSPLRAVDWLRQLIVMTVIYRNIYNLC